MVHLSRLSIKLIMLMSGLDDAIEDNVEVICMHGDLPFVVSHLCHLSGSSNFFIGLLALFLLPNERHCPIFMTKQITPTTVTSLCDWPFVWPVDWPFVWPVVWPSMWPNAYHHNLTTNLVQMTIQSSANDAHLTPLSGCNHSCCWSDTCSMTCDLFLSILVYVTIFYVN